MRMMEGVDTQHDSNVQLKVIKEGAFLGNLRDLKMVFDFRVEKLQESGEEMRRRMMMMMETMDYSDPEPNTNVKGGGYVSPPPPPLRG